MAAERRHKPHETGDAKMKAAALRTVKTGEKAPAVPSPAKELQAHLHSHYQPLSKRMSVILVSLLVAFAFVGGWMGGVGAMSWA